MSSPITRVLYKVTSTRRLLSEKIGSKLYRTKSYLEKALQDSL